MQALNSKTLISEMQNNQCISGTMESTMCWLCVHDELNKIGETKWLHPKKIYQDEHGENKIMFTLKHHKCQPKNSAKRQMRYIWGSVWKKIKYGSFKKDDSYIKRDYPQAISSKG